MKKTVYFIISFFVLISSNQSAIFSQLSENTSEYNSLPSYVDPVSSAVSIINNDKTKVIFHQSYKAMVNLFYNVGFSVARYGGRYLMVESPKLAADMIKRGYYGVISDITYDLLIEIVKQAVETPDILCVNIAQSTKKEGVKGYNIAYDIYNKYKETGILTNEEAILFINGIWSAEKLASARRLYIESNEDYNIDNKVAEEATYESIKLYESALKTKFGSNGQVPLVDAAKFINDIYKILESKKIGLADYPPYIKYSQDITDINNFWLNKLGIPSYNKPSMAGNENLENSNNKYLIIPGKSVGPIDYNSTINDLITFYGKENIETKTEFTAGEGTELETLTYIKNWGLTIRWKDQVTQNLNNPVFISIENSAINYHTAEGIRIGTSAQELGIINGRPFDYRDMEVQPFKMVTDWKGGKLEKYGSEMLKSWLIKLDYFNMEIVGLVVIINQEKANNNDLSTDKIESVYGSIIFKGRTWMDKNLNTDRYQNGDLIPEAKTDAEWQEYGKRGVGAWCYYNNDPSNGQKYGRLYNWYAVSDSRRLAPKGWQIPSNYEWDVLGNYYHYSTGGNYLKSTNGWANNSNGNNQSGFTGLPSGYRDRSGFHNLGYSCAWWTSDVHESGGAYHFSLWVEEDIITGYFTKDMGLSVRCVKD